MGELLPAGKVPTPQDMAQFGFAVDVEFDLDIAGVRTNGFHGQPQPGGDLRIGVPQAGQRGNLLFTWR